MPHCQMPTTWAKPTQPNFPPHNSRNQQRLSELYSRHYQVRGNSPSGLHLSPFVRGHLDTSSFMFENIFPSSRNFVLIWSKLDELGDFKFCMLSLEVPSFRPSATETPPSSSCWQLTQNTKATMVGHSRGMEALLWRTLLMR